MQSAMVVSMPPTTWCSLAEGSAVFLCEDVAAVAVEDGKVDVHAAACEVAIRLGHEGGVQVVLAGDALDDALEKEGVVGCRHQRIR